MKIRNIPVYRPLDLVIKERMQLPTNQKLIETIFGITPQNAASNQTIQLVKQWNEERQNQYIELIGGRFNINRTRQLFGLPRLPKKPKTEKKSHQIIKTSSELLAGVKPI